MPENLNIEKQKETSQTSTEENAETIVKTDETKAEENHETAGGDEGNQEEKPDADGKYTHPETKTKVSADDMVRYYRDKFANSTKGAQELLEKNKTLLEGDGLSKGQIATLTKEIEDLRKLAEGKNPEGLKLSDVNANLTRTTNELALLKETAELDNFEKANPLASSRRDALRSLARANPKESLQKLWDDNLKSGAEAQAKQKKDDDEARKKNGGEKGKGTGTREISGDTIITEKGYDTGMTLAEFNKLPVGKRAELLKK